jgi:hypothetical protein
MGGWQLMYQLLQKGEWQIADTCPKLIEAIPSRMHDEKKPGDVLKVPGDPLDDVADDARYGIYTFITSTEKPLEVVLRETLAPIIETAQDTSLSEAERKAAATSVLLRRQQIMAESQRASQSATLGRYRTRGR